jgi:hypothetical protein
MMSQWFQIVGGMSIAVLLSGGLTGCSMNPFANEATPNIESTSQQGQTIWSSGKQYVRLVDSDAASENNHHPAVISAQDLKTILASIYITEGFVLKNDKIPAFSAGEQQLLSSALSQALARVSQNEDVTFATTATYSSTFTEQQKSNSGRVFMSANGRLNIIFGLLHADYENSASSLFAGKRNREVTLESALSLQPGQHFHIDPNTGLERTDWLVIDTPRLLAQAKNTMSNGSYVNSELLQDVSKSKQETGNLKQDVSKIKEIIFELTDEVERLKREVEQLKSKR